ncbi:hypothetical protein GCM10012275_33460 [Longimycelium tulufanense]|uniref:YbaB/EbfC DNA-binding family protein n=1 Tax=Longimycelium tulufanense TaxID=907463 RepID=A0A8J3CDT8_9PSEU|nr:YbaB/EbfC family nucleoid-associated protein [Longimycelium tulufanense]GGM59651.1 hypothetical protein GCM10012275_33460 [Longimycelium tulufanense]
MSEEWDRQTPPAVDPAVRRAGNTSTDPGTGRVADQVARTQYRVAEQLARTGPVTGHASSADGAVSVVVSPGGMLRSVRLTPAALHMGPDALAKEVVELAGRATRNAAARLHAALRGVLDQASVRNLEELGIRPYSEPDSDSDGYDPFSRRGF